MKKNSLLIATFVFIAFCSMMVAGDKPGGVGDNPSKADSLKNKLKHLTESSQYDSAINLCSAIRQNGGLGYDDLETALANVYAAKGDKATAYDYVLNNTDYLIKANAGQQLFPPMLFDYNYAYPLATDTFLEKIIIDKVSEFYSGLHHFPQATSGLKFMLLEYRLNKLRAKCHFALCQNPDKEHARKLSADFDEALEDLAGNYMEEVRQNDKLLTWKEAGPGFETQVAFLIWINDAGLHTQMQPYFEKAFKAGEIGSALYVDQLTWLAGLKEKDKVKLDQLHDSLCAAYGCQPMREAYFNKRKGDSMVFINQNRFGTPDRDNRN